MVIAVFPRLLVQCFYLRLFLLLQSARQAKILSQRPVRLYRFCFPYTRCGASRTGNRASSRECLCLYFCSRVPSAVVASYKVPAPSATYRQPYCSSGIRLQSLAVVREISDRSLLSSLRLLLCSRPSRRSTPATRKEKSSRRI